MASKTGTLLPPPVTQVSSAADRRLAVQRADQEREQARQRELEQQASPGTEPQERIRIWERLHALQLPVRESHPLILVIANQTGLKVREVRDEQRRRAQGSSHSSVNPSPG